MLKKINARQPLLLRAAVALILLGLIRAAVAFGWVPPEWGEIDAADVERAIDVVIMGVTFRSIHRVVTPVATPRNAEGVPLVPAQRRPY
ncbi:hypothetical protein HNP84_007314 [Thermocatellispora tengchongensis]|uniref:Uncharacterized protein n=1 Tax=Thermocatellispora tengchongensis TaxID=1073253 RepID=A0A840PEG2_9ACTN|nr:hypothetical protein [Thermocatellispora tengchongensis]MBB5137562.1 hypothetical protein [Thermocatellispora tengchongensis]